MISKETVDKINELKRQKKELKASLAPKTEEQKALNRRKSAIKYSAKLNQGIKPTSYNYGYARIGTMQYVPVNEEKVIIEEMFESYLDLKSVRKVAETLNDKGHRTRRNTKWSEKSVYNILTNPIYIGIIEWMGKTSTGNHTHLIEESIFTEAQKILKRNENGKEQL